MPEKNVLTTPPHRILKVLTAVLFIANQDVASSWTNLTLSYFRMCSLLQTIANWKRENKTTLIIQIITDLAEECSSFETLKLLLVRCLWPFLHSISAAVDISFLLLLVWNDLSFAVDYLKLVTEKQTHFLSSYHMHILLKKNQCLYVEHIFCRCFSST